MGKLYTLLLSLISLAALAQPNTHLNETFDALFTDIKHSQLDTVENYQNLIATHISPRIDIVSMSQLILGNHWKRSSIEQKQTFMSCFTRQFRHTQAETLAQWKPTRWHIESESFNKNKTKAITKVTLQKGNEERTFNLRLKQVDNQWLLYDVSYLGLSLLKQFKDDYSLKISRYGLNKTLALVCQDFPETVKRLTLAGTIWPPYISRIIPGQGLSVEIVTNVLTRAGYQVEMVFTPWKRVIEGMKQGDFDVSVASWKSESRMHFLSFSDPYFKNNLVMIYHKDTMIIPGSLDDVLSQKLSLGLMRDYAYSPKIQQYPDRRYFKQYGPLYRELASKSLNFTLLDKNVAHYYLNRFSSLKADLQVSTITLDSKPLHISMIKQHPAAPKVLEDFNRYLKMYLKSPAYQALLARYKIKNGY